MQPMVEKLWQLSIMSGGLLPLMAVLLLVTLAVIIERSYFFHRVLKSGLAMEHDLQLVEYQNVDKLERLAAHYEGSLQRSLISSALASRGNDADTMERHIEEAIMWQLPRIDKHVWVLDTAVTLAPLMGLVATGVGLFIAIIAVLFLNHFNKRVRLALHQMDLLKVMLINRLYGGGSSHQGVPVREAHAAKVTELKTGKGQ
jgi:biopolymer transport protein ExbB